MLSTPNGTEQFRSTRVDDAETLHIKLEYLWHRAGRDVAQAARDDEFIAVLSRYESAFDREREETDGGG